MLTTTAPVRHVPELETELDDDTLTDATILGTARETRVARVAGILSGQAGRSGVAQSHSARAWTIGGNVD